MSNLFSDKHGGRRRNPAVRPPLKRYPLRKAETGIPKWLRRLRNQILIAFCLFAAVYGACWLPLGWGDQAQLAAGTQFNKHYTWEAMEASVKHSLDQLDFSALPVFGQPKETGSSFQLRKPVEGSITSGYGPRLDPLTKVNDLHQGVDFEAALGTAFTAAADGKVASLGEEEDYGLVLRLEHSDGYTTLYAHLLRVAVEAGEEVEAGQVLGWTGASGKASGPHLHFELAQNGEAVDPTAYWR